VAWSSPSISARVSLNESAPAFSAACLPFLAPGMGRDSPSTPAGRQRRLSGYSRVGAEPLLQNPAANSPISYSNDDRQQGIGRNFLHRTGQQYAAGGAAIQIDRDVQIKIRRNKIGAQSVQGEVAC